MCLWWCSQKPLLILHSLKLFSFVYQNCHCSYDETDNRPVCVHVCKTFLSILSIELSAFGDVGKLERHVNVNSGALHQKFLVSIEFPLKEQIQPGVGDICTHFACFVF